MDSHYGQQQQQQDMEPRSFPPIDQTHHRYDIHDGYDYEYLGQPTQPHLQHTVPLYDPERNSSNASGYGYQGSNSGVITPTSSVDFGRYVDTTQQQQQHHYFQGPPPPPHPHAMPYPRQLHEGPQFAGGFAVRASRTYQHHTRIPSHSEAEDDHLGYDYDDTDQHMFQSSFRLDDWWARAPLEPRPLNKLAYSEVRPQGGVDIAPLGSFSLAHQEMLIMDDLLYVMIGIQGKYIEIRLPTTSCHQSSTEAQSAIDQIDYIVDETMDPSLKAMVFKILPIASYYIEIERFSIAYTRAAAGLVNQALCAAIRSLLREHTVLVAQLEHRLRSCTAKSPFTLQQFWFHIHPTLRVLQRVAMLVEAIKKEVLLQQQELDRKEQEKGLTTIIGDIDEDDEDDVDDGDDEKAGSGEGGGKADRLDGKGSGSEGEGERTRHSFYERNIYVRGGRTLNIIAEQLKIHGGDATTRELYSFLLYQASAPFFQMLRKWLKYGQIDDSSARGPENGEFMIRHVQGKIAALASTDEEVIVIQERDDIQKSKENVILKFYLQPDLTPNFLRPFGKRVILTGKYLNVVKACGVDLDGIASESMKTDGVEGDNEKDGKEILDTLNTLALKESESAMENSDVMKALDGREIIKEINRAYVNANQALLKVLLGEGKLKEYLRGIKRYLLFDQSDFITHFLDLALRELNKPVKELAHTKLQSLLDIALRNPASVAYADPYKEHVQIKMTKERLLDALSSLRQNTEQIAASADGGGAYSHHSVYDVRLSRSNSTLIGGGVSMSGVGGSAPPLSCIEALNLSFYITFPSNMVLHHIAKNKYSLIHRHLLALKHLEQRLCNDWNVDIKRSSHSLRQIPPAKDKAKTSNNADVEEADVEGQRRKLHLRLFALRNRMLLCIQQILHYSCWEVIEPNWNDMLAKIEKAATVDELMHTHTVFLDSSLLQCGLSNIKLTKIFTKVISRCHQFLQFTAHHIKPGSVLYPSGVGVIGSSGSDAQVARLTSAVLASQSARQQDHDSAASGSEDEDTRRAQQTLAQLQKFEVTLGKMEEGFKNSLKMLVDGLNFYARSQTNQYLNLAIRLDYSQYYAP